MIVCLYGFSPDKRCVNSLFENETSSSALHTSYCYSFRALFHTQNMETFSSHVFWGSWEQRTQCAIFRMFNSPPSNKNWIQISSSPRSFTRSAFLINFDIYKLKKEACTQKLWRQTIRIAANKAVNSHAWTTRHTTTHFCAYLGFSTLFPHCVLAGVISMQCL